MHKLVKMMRTKKEGKEGDVSSTNVTAASAPKDAKVGHESESKEGDDEVEVHGSIGSLSIETELGTIKADMAKTEVTLKHKDSRGRASIVLDVVSIKEQSFFLNPIWGQVLVKILCLAAFIRLGLSALIIASLPSVDASPPEFHHLLKRVLSWYIIYLSFLAAWFYLSADTPDSPQFVRLAAITEILSWSGLAAVCVVSSMSTITEGLTGST